jgi:hypothetical protein
MPSPSSSDVLRDALASLAPSAYQAAGTVPGSLHEKVCAVVNDLKADGMKPEHVILAVKGIAFEAEMGPSSWRLVETLVKWCLEQYFKDDK